MDFKELRQTNSKRTTCDPRNTDHYEGRAKDPGREKAVGLQKVEWDRNQSEKRIEKIITDPECGCGGAKKLFQEDNNRRQRERQNDDIRKTDALRR